MSRNFEIVRKDVGANFQAPKEIILSEYDRAQKIELLKQWELDVREKMVAEEEGMTGAGAAPDGALLKTIQSCLIELKAGGKATAAANKAGGGMEALRKDEPIATD
jgi:hypothetical protein